jgi:hypothetical protein
LVALSFPRSNLFETKASHITDHWVLNLSQINTLQSKNQTPGGGRCRVPALCRVPAGWVPLSRDV